MTLLREQLHVMRPARGRARSARAQLAESGGVAKHEGHLIRELQQVLRTRIESRIRARGIWLSFPHAMVLTRLRDQPGLSGAQLARLAAVTAQTMNGLLLPLEKKGMIERRPDPENARILRCYVKPRGVALLEQGMREVDAVFEQMFGALSQRERAEFRRLLRQCIVALNSRAEDAEAEVAGNGRKRASARRATSI